MTSTRVWAVFAFLGALIAIGGLVVYLPTSGKAHEGHTPAEILKRNGYLEIRPAMQLNGPGTIVTVEQKTDDFVMLHPTCKMDATELTALWQSSSSVDTDVANELSGEFELGVNLLKRVGLDVGGHAIREIDIKYERTKVIVLTDEERFGLGNKYLKDNCLQAVKQITSEKKCVTQPISAMQADVSYRIKFSNDIAASEKARILEKTKVLGDVSGGLAAEQRMDSTDAIIGKGLFVGLKLDAGCIVPNDGKHDSDADAKTVENLPATKNGTTYVKR
jgi:hypothetical protein